ncbi:Pectin acetylesterase 9 [Zea mays]|uniref:Pectin acetylesterase 9 n=1 Tax=Zea mays TaxID=4577 RepID=A0A1D6NMF1_MAIZE|nr:Pectin acetylesterase 9 [Zea mays]ONM41364.1 Pectin acetylesterase 9 [Zea mays]ONM41369.1 Pectin acetylesterase 9 [Zea mays]
MYNRFISEGSIAGGTAGVVVETSLYPISTYILILKGGTRASTASVPPPDPAHPAALSSPKTYCVVPDISASAQCPARSPRSLGAVTAASAP